jgi:hypothetical protein
MDNMLDFDEWFVEHLGCEWEDYEENLGEGNMARAFQAGREYERYKSGWQKLPR